MLRVTLALLVLCTIAAFGGSVLEGRQREPEQTVRAYLAAVERDDIAVALATVQPEARQAARARIDQQLGNRYQVGVIAIGRPSMLDRLRGSADRYAWATITAEVSRPEGTPWKSSAIVRLVERDGRWYLIEPPFA